MKTATHAKQTTLITRPPVVVVLGHIDHGKTTLLDAIRKTDVVAGEAGGITQHIGAYHIEHNNRTMAFIDTPGHEAFAAMRSRGAVVADVGVLVVAADDGVKPQTKEAIKILQNAKLPFVVAFTKIDKPGANVARAKQQLSEHGVIIEEWGGTIPAQEVSGKSGVGVNELLDIVLLVADVEELKGNLSLPAAGVIIESHRDAKRGNITTVLIKNGTLRQGDFIVAEHVGGKIKAIEDANGASLKEASFMKPAVVLSGFDELPLLGATFSMVASKEEMTSFIEKTKAAMARTKQSNAHTLSDAPALKIILKADKQGSLEAIAKSIEQIKQEKVRAEILFQGTGDVSETDIKLAYSTGASIFHFHVKTGSDMQLLASKFNVSLKSFDVIYELLETIEGEMKLLLKPVTERIVQGRVKILGVFKASGNEQVVGGKVTSGVIKRNAMAHIVRGARSLAQGTIGQLQQNKIDVAQVAEGFECGLLFKGKSDTPRIEVGDIIETFEEKTTDQTL